MTNNGTVQREARHYPFGEIRWESGNLPDEQRFDFTGMGLERSVGLLDYHARYYDPLLGRFISADSVVPDFNNPQDLNRYAYVRNSPLNWVDPSGHAVDRVGDVGLEGLYEYYVHQSTEAGSDYGGHLSEYFANLAVLQLETHRGNAENAGLAAAHAESALMRAKINGLEGSDVALDTAFRMSGDGVLMSMVAGVTDGGSFTKRPSHWRKGVREIVEDKAPVDADGNMRCMGCDDIMPKPDLDHYPPVYKRREQRTYDTRQEFLNDYQNPDELRPLCPRCNRGHQFENVPTEQLPYYDKYFGGD